MCQHPGRECHKHGTKLVRTQNMEERQEFSHSRSMQVTKNETTIPIFIYSMLLIPSDEVILGQILLTGFPVTWEKKIPGLFLHFQDFFGLACNVFKFFSTEYTYQSCFPQLTKSIKCMNHVQLYSLSITITFSKRLQFCSWYFFQHQWNWKLDMPAR